MSRKRILVVEDEILISLDIEMTLEQLGHEVTTASTVREAMAGLERGSVDLAILDYHLTDGDTTALALHLHKSGIPFIICSGSAGLAELGEVFASARFLSKPYSSDSLLDAVSGVANEIIMN